MPCVLTVLIASLLQIAQPNPQLVEQTLTGELICQTCYLKDHTNVGQTHVACATICAKRGAPLAIVAGDGRMYVLAGDLIKEDAAKLRPFVGQCVDIKGRPLQQREGTIYLFPNGAQVKSLRRILPHDGFILEGREIKTAAKPC